MQMACRSAALLCLLSASLAPAAHANQALMVARRGPMPSAGGAMRLRGGSAVEPAIPAEDKSLATHAVDYALAGAMDGVRSGFAQGLGAIVQGFVAAGWLD
ncbi:hypothetical protein T484DRAFT_1861395 [Baffinella frigidus]|nr:hypothetical protein T484DRAFT_1861395 [Cryptophyta sp. CCMP2293]